MHRTLQFRPEIETDEWFNLRIDLVIGASQGHYEDSVDAMRSLRLGDRLQDIETPTLVIAGAVDGLLEANLMDFARLPNATLQVFSFAGHEVALHEPEGVAQAIKNLMIHGPIRAEALMRRLRE